MGGLNLIRTIFINNKRILTNLNLTRCLHKHSTLQSNYVLNRIKTPQRYISTNTIVEEKEKLPPQDKKKSNLIDLDLWTPIYRFNQITVARLVQRAKIVQTCFTIALSIPTAIMSFENSYAVYGALSVSVLACGMLYIMGTFFSRLACIIYASKEDESKFLVAQLTFFGKRQDKEFSKEDFVPISDLPDALTEIYIIMRRYSDPDYKLYFSLPYGKILDVGEFEKIFGKINYKSSK